MKKSLWLKTLALVLIVAMMSVMFVACKKDKEPEEPSGTPSTTIEATDVTDLIMEGLANAVKDEKLSELNMGAQLTVKANDETYTIKLGVILDLLEVNDKKADGTYNVTSNDSEFSLNVTDKNNAQLFNAYYADGTPSANVYGGNRLYVAYKNADGTMTKAAVKAPFVMETMKKQNGYVWDNEINDGAMDLIEDTIPGALTMAAGIIGRNPVIAADKKSCSLDIPLTELIDPSTELGQMIAGLNVDNYLTSLGIKGSLSDILNALPSIAIKVSATFDKDAALSGLKLGLELGKTTQNMVIKHTNDKDLINIAISKDLSVELGFDFAMGQAAQYMVYQNSYADYREVSALNATLSADLVLAKGIDNRINFGDGTQYLGITIPAGTYKASVALDIDPTVLLGAQFTTPVPTYYLDKDGVKHYIDKDDSTKSYTVAEYEANKDKVLQSSVANFDVIISEVLEAINYIELSVASTDTTVLHIKAYKKGGALYVETVNLDLINNSNITVINIQSIKALAGTTLSTATVNSILGGVLKPETEKEVANPNATSSGSAESASGTPSNSIDDTLKGIKPYIDGLGIKIDSNGLVAAYSASFGDASKGEVVTNLVASLLIGNTFSANVKVTNNAVGEYFTLDLDLTLQNVKFGYGTAVVPTAA